MVIIPKPVWEALAKGDVKSCCRFRNIQASLLGGVSLLTLFPGHLLLEVVRFAWKLNGQEHARLVSCLDDG